MRSSASGSVVYSSTRKPVNSEPVDLSTTRSVSPETTWAPSEDRSTSVVRTSPPRRTNAWSWPAPSTGIRSQAYSSTRMRAPVAAGVASSRRRARASA